MDRAPGTRVEPLGIQPNLRGGRKPSLCPDGTQPREREGRLTNGRTIRVVVVDDSPVDLKALCDFLGKQEQIEIVGTASNGVELMSVAEGLRPDLVITDLHMPRLSGIECTLRLRELMPQTRFIVFTDLNAPFTERECAEPGADVYLYKEQMPERVMTAIHRLFPDLRPPANHTPRELLPSEGCPEAC
jgi:DNA-binding NarL/FixJ family response regulator